MGRTTHPATAGPTRREVLAGAGVLVGVLAACSSPSTPGNGGTTPGGDPTGPLASVSDIPVGGAVSATLDGRPILLTQAEAGTIVGLSAICTHQQCTVQPGDGDLRCPCHGSRYDLSGAVTNGPAPDPLPPVEVHVEGGDVLAGPG